MKDKEFLNWIANRFVNVHNESDHVDFVQKLRAIAEVTPEDQDTDWIAWSIRQNGGHVTGVLKALHPDSLQEIAVNRERHAHI